MPPPGKPSPSGAAGLSAREADEVDPDYHFFLNHVRLDGNSFALYIPSNDGVSPPEVIRYEQPLPGTNVGGPVAGSEVGGQGGPPPLEEHSLAPRESPHAAPYGAAYPRAGVKRKAPDASPRAEARSGAVPMVGDPPAPVPVAEPAWYDSQPDIDEDYRFFLRHVRVVNEGTAVFKMGNLKIPMGHEPSVDNSDAEEDGDADQEDESIPASGQSGEDGVCTEEEESVDAEKEVELGSDLQIVNVFDLEVKEEEVSEEEEEDEEEEEVGEEDEEWKEEEEVDFVEGKDVGTGSDLQIVNILEYEMKNKVEEEEKPLNAPVQGITELEPLNREASSSKRHPAISRNASELQGVIWPPHIIERPNSHFKKKLMEILIKPFKQEEYDRYVAMATNRSPVVKERRTRHRVVYYPWRHEMGKSYFDSHPDLAEQFKLQGNNYPNRLALLRGFFFWLQNVGQEDQFRPWRDDFQKYRVVSFT